MPCSSPYPAPGPGMRRRDPSADTSVSGRRVATSQYGVGSAGSSDLHPHRPLEVGPEQQVGPRVGVGSREAAGGLGVEGGRGAEVPDRDVRRVPPGAPRRPPGPGRRRTTRAPAAIATAAVPVTAQTALVGSATSTASQRQATSIVPWTHQRRGTESRSSYSTPRIVGRVVSPPVTEHPDLAASLGGRRGDPPGPAGPRPPAPGVRPPRRRGRRPAHHRGRHPGAGGAGDGADRGGDRAAARLRRARPPALRAGRAARAVHREHARAPSTRATAARSRCCW